MMRLEIGMPILCLLFAAGLLGPKPAAAQNFSSDAEARSASAPALGDGVYRALVPGGNTVVDASGRLYRIRPLRSGGERRHTLSLEAGFLPAGHGEGCCGVWDVPNDSFPGECLYYEGPLRVTGALGIAYGFRVLNWLELGASLSYSGQFRDLMDSSGAVASRHREHCLALMPYVRFAWLNRRIVRLYSGAHLGGQWCGERSWTQDRTSTRVRVAGQLTMIGVGLGGHRVFGFAELGYGMRGVLVAGVGYRFGTVQ